MGEILGEIPKSLDMNELKRMHWNEWLDMNELTWVTWKEWIAKTGPNPPVFDDFMWNRALATVSCTFCRPLSGSRRAPTTEPLYLKKPQGSAPESVCSREFTRSRSLTLPNYLMMMMMMMMMMWLTRWCGWHDGQTASRWQSSVTRKFPN